MKSYKSKREVKKLTEISMDAVYPLLSKYAEVYNLRSEGPLDCLAGDLTELLMARALETNQIRTPLLYLFLTPKVKRALLPWDTRVWRIAKNKCRSLKHIYVTSKNVKFNTAMLDLIPAHLYSIDLHGDLFFRGKGVAVEFSSNWLTESESWLRCLRIESDQIPQLPTMTTLTELHLGDAQVSRDDLAQVIKRLPGLKLLRHYQLAAALCQLHAQNWKSSSSIPTYELTNIDADFSHVGRSTMELTSVLAWDALKLAVALCPKATSVRIRFDCSTPHHVASHLTVLNKLVDLSAVCVTSGERTLLDFSDLAPLLEKHGPDSLTSLELKVLEEVDPHVIARFCPLLERLILSGCGYVTPARCPQFRCAAKPQHLTKLKVLFYADGDDFSWDHSLPQCFWKTTLSSSIRSPNRLNGIFLESPRMSSQTISELIGPSKPFPNLRVLSLCRVPEITLHNLQEFSKSSVPLKYLRLSACENITVRLGAKIKQLYPGVELKIG